MPQAPVIPDPRLDFLLAVDRLLTAADQARCMRDRLLELTRLSSKDAAKQEPAGARDYPVIAPADSRQWGETPKLPANGEGGEP
jgi:hypothetical protein